MSSCKVLILTKLKYYCQTLTKVHNIKFLQKKKNHPVEAEVFHAYKQMNSHE